MTRKQFLCENFTLFKEIDEKTIDKILAFDGIFEETFSPNDIMQSNTISSKICIILKGKAIIKSGDYGVLIKKLSKNDIFGAAALFDKPKHLTIVKAVTECTVISMSKEFITKCITESSIFATNYIEFLAKKVSFLNSKINAYTAKSAENKLYAYLLQLPRQDNVVTLPNDMSTLAKMIGIGRATLYRAFEKLEANGTIVKEEKNIILKEE